MSAKWSFTKSQQLAVVVLLIIAGVLQAVLFFDFSSKDVEVAYTEEELLWLDNQKELSKIKEAKDSLQKQIKKFNPNYITDYKGYVLGMSPQEIDKLHRYRSDGNQFVNSSHEFQKVTGVSDSLLQLISPYFKFPEWVTKSRQKLIKKKIIPIDINKAKKSDFQKVSGIGKVLSNRIFKERDLLGGFVDVKQLGWVYGISDDVAQEMTKYFTITEPEVGVNKLPINQSSLKELMQFPYFDYALSKEIIIYRTMHGNDIGIEDLYNINGFPKEKVGIIALYLQF